MTNKPSPDTRRAAAALLLLSADWEEQVAGPGDRLDYVRLMDKTNAFIEAAVELAVKRVRADMREPSRVPAPPFNLSDVHYLTEDLRDACGKVPSDINVRMAASWDLVTCPACLLTSNRGESSNDRSSETTAQAAEPEAAAVDAEPQTEHAAPSALTYDEASAGLGHDE